MLFNQLLIVISYGLLIITLYNLLRGDDADDGEDKVSNAWERGRGREGEQCMGEREEGEERVGGGGGGRRGRISAGGEAIEGEEGEQLERGWGEEKRCGRKMERGRLEFKKGVKEVRRGRGGKEGRGRGGGEEEG